MQISFRNAAVLLSLAVAASLSWYFSRPPAETAQAPAGPEGAPLGYYLRDATLLGTDETGRTFFSLHAAETVQDPNEQGLALTDVRIDYRDEESVGWSIEAEHAVAPGNLSYVDLEQARVESTETSPARRTIISSEYLRLDPEAYYVSTDAPVRIRVGDMSLDGVGLEARLREDFIASKNVHGEFSR